MVEFRVVVSDPKSGRSVQVPVSGQHANVLVRRKIGDEIDGMFVGLPGYKLRITGGTDKDGFAMRPEVPGAVRKRILVSRSLGFNPAREGMRKRKTFRGSEVGPDTMQINTVVTQHGPKPITELVKKEEKKA